MFRLAVAVSLLLSAVCAAAQSAPSSDPVAVSLAQKSVTALTGGAQVADVTLNANVTAILGSDTESGTATLEAKGTGESRVDLSLSGGTRSDVRNLTNGVAGGAWAKNGGTSTAYAQHNCWTDAAWFFPALSSLTQTANPNFIFKYTGQQQHGGVNTQHIQIYQAAAQGLGQVQSISTMDFYLDPTSLRILGVAYKIHPDNNVLVDIPVEVRFANYQLVNGIEVPFHIQRLQNGSLMMDVTVTGASFNTGLSENTFAIP